MTITTKRVERCLKTVEAIASLDTLTGYLIGYTGLSASIKGDQYKVPSQGFHHFVILADKLTFEDSLDLEAYLQRRTMGGQPGTVVYEKYHTEKRDRKRFYRSAGGQKDRGRKEYSVYMVWYEGE
jgi:hypothetical protein